MRHLERELSDTKRKHEDSKNEVKHSPSLRVARNVVDVFVSYFPRCVNTLSYVKKTLKLEWFFRQSTVAIMFCGFSSFKKFISLDAMSYFACRNHSVNMQAKMTLVKFRC